MTTIHLKKRNGDEIAIEATDNLSLMENIHAAAPSELLAVCGGCMSCGTCHVFVNEDDLARLDEMSEEEDFLLDDSPLRQDNSRLSCQITVTPALENLRVEAAPED